MKRYIIFVLAVLSLSSGANTSMRRCTLLPVTDSVGGAIGFKVFEIIEEDLKQGNWCTYISNSGMINIFSRYRENLQQHLKSKEVLATVGEKLQAGSIIRVALVSEISGVEIQMDIFGENGEDLYFSEKTNLERDDVEEISGVVKSWIDMYSKTIPYDAKILGVLGEQLTLDVGKGYPIKVGQKFIIKRPLTTKKHPLLKKIVDWDTEILGEGQVFSVSDNQALGVVKVYRSDKKLSQGDWIRLEEFKQEIIDDAGLGESKKESLGTLGVLSVAMIGASSSLDTSTASGSRRMSGNAFGVNFRAEGWITREYFGAIEIMRSIGSLSKASGIAEKSRVNINSGSFKLTGGYKYLPIGFFYGPQIDIYGGYANHYYDLDFSENDGFGQNSFSGLLFGTNANIPLNREFRFFARGEFIPFPTFTDEDGVFTSAKNVSSLELEVGIKYQYTMRVTIDGGIQTVSRKAKFSGDNKEASYKDNMLKIGASFNF